MGAEQQLREQMEAPAPADGGLAVVGGHTFPDHRSDDLHAQVETIAEALVALHGTMLLAGHQIDYLSQRMSELEKTADWLEGKVRRG